MGDSTELWAQLQGLLEGLERSAVRGRAWVTPYITCENKEATQHLTAATESWVQVTQLLEEMEREFGISYLSELPAEERQRYQRDVLALHKNNCSLRNTLRCRDEELGRSKITLSGLEEERNRLRKKLLSFQKNVQTRGSLSPPISPSSSSSEAQSPCWTSPPYPGSPLVLKRSPSTGTAVCLTDSVLSSASSSTPGYSTMEAELAHLQSGIENLRGQNIRLSSALERRKGESEQMSMILSRHEADNAALQMALKYRALIMISVHDSEECEEAYSQLLSLYEAKKQRDTSQSRGTAESRGDKCQLSGAKQGLNSTEAGELPASSCPPGGAEQSVKQSRGTSSLLLGQEVALRERILSLKRDKAAVCIPEQKPDGEGKLSPDTGTLAAHRGSHSARHCNTKKEKAALLYDLHTVREEMSELRGIIRLTERENRYLEWTLVAQREQEVAGALIAYCLQEELEDMQTERRMLKRQMTALWESLDNALTDSATRRRYSEKEMAQFALMHRKTADMFRSTRKKYHEQLWRLQRRMVALCERHVTQIAGLKAKLEVLEERREETVL
ncbi:colorectal mutant cancer protein-like [Scleropages formosus]|uniref:Colorectal mutant cancer protein-like n=1 Tax=Scleropages formosus TaxID=113540 RepID=A0A0P7VBC6_SCLFO|nr:colorectal mutant cancer protein-like [Scleropages formosus]